MRIRLQLFATILVSLITLSYGYAEAPLYVINVGGVNLSLPTPPDFTEPSTLAPTVRNLGETFTPAGNRLLAIFVSNNDAQLAKAGKEMEMTRYFMVQTLRQTENKPVSKSDFEKIKTILKTQQQNLLAKAKKEITPAINNATKNLSQDTGDPTLSLKLGEVLPLEVIQEENDAFTLIMLTKNAVTKRGVITEMPMIGASTTLLSKGKLVYFYAFSQYRSKDDKEWARKATINWIKQFRAAN
jgi:hypothetical protein